MSYEEVGAFLIKQTPAGWSIGSVFEPLITSTPAGWPEIEKLCRNFIATVEKDLERLGLDPSKIIRQ